MKLKTWYHALGSTFWQRSTLLLLLATVFALPLQRRIQLTSSDTFITGAFTEYSSYFIYLTDIALLMLTLSFSILIIKEKLRRQLFSGILPKLVMVFFVVLLLLLPFSSQLPHSAYYIVRLFLLICFALAIGYFAQKARNFTLILTSLILSGLLQSTIAILQFTLQRSLGLFYLTGESHLSPIMDNVAKVVVNGDRFMRAYGTFPHPNILAAFLVVALLSLIAILPKLLKHRLGLIAGILAFTVLGWGLIVALSRTSFLYGLIAVIILLSSLFPVKRLGLAIATCAIIGVLLIGMHWSYLTARLTTGNAVNDISLSMRQQLDEFANKEITKHPLVGTGINTVIFTEIAVTPGQPAWMYQPIHNIYRLLLVETGMIGLAAFIALSGLLLACGVFGYIKKPHIRGAYAFTVLAFLLSIACYDHFLLTLQQGQMLLWLAVGFGLSQINVARETRSTNN